MRLEWLEDILAVAETGSFSEAAERRGLTQSAFSRRIRLIEDRVGVELFDRARKPVTLRPTTAAQRDAIARLAEQLRDLVRDLRDGAGSTGQRIAIAGQHALTATRTTAFIEALRRSDDRVRVELISANLDACFAHLLARRADIALVYREPGVEHPVRPDFVEVAVLGSDRLIPVWAAASARGAAALIATGNIPYVAYPASVFFGELLDRAGLRRLRDEAAPVPLAETALTTAALDMARAGIGVAWVPETLAADDLASGRLSDLSGRLPWAPLEITAVRLRGEARPVGRLAWAVVTGGFAADVVPSE